MGERYPTRKIIAKRNFVWAKNLFMSHLVTDCALASAIITDRSVQQILAPNVRKDLTGYFFAETLVLISSFLNLLKRNDERYY